MTGEYVVSVVVPIQREGDKLYTLCISAKAFVSTKESIAEDNKEERNTRCFG